LGIWTGGLAASLLERAPQRYWTRPLAFASCAALLLAIHYQPSRRAAAPIQHAQEDTWAVISELRRLELKPQPNERLLFINGPFGDYWDMYFISKLYYRDSSLRVAIVTPGEPNPRGDEHKTFDREFRWTDGRLIQQR
jgi:hypothetical protein